MEVITVGGATIDAFLHLEHSTDSIQLDHEKGELRIKAGEKIEVDSCTFSLGGNACNVVVGLARLGFLAGICAEIGNDDFAIKIIHGLEQEQVDTTHLIQTEGTASSFAIALNIEAERTLFVEHGQRAHNFHLDDLSAKWMYLTSVGETWEHVYQYVREIIIQKNIQLAYSPGTRQLERPSDAVKALFPVAQMLCLNKTEAMKIVKFYLEREENDIKQLMELLHTLGPKIISLTDGSHGGFARDEAGNTWDIDRFPQDVIERTGAGDAYATGFFAAIMEGKSVPDAMRYGTMNAASVIGTIGAQKGLLTKEEMEKRLAAHPDFQARKL